MKKGCFDMTKQAHRARSETYAMIARVLKVAERPLSRAEIAHLLNRKKTPHLVAMIDDFVIEGLVERSVKTYPNGVQGYVYRWISD